MLYSRFTFRGPYRIVSITFIDHNFRSHHWPLKSVRLGSVIFADLELLGPLWFVRHISGWIHLIVASHLTLSLCTTHWNRVSHADFLWLVGYSHLRPLWRAALRFLIRVILHRLLDWLVLFVLDRRILRFFLYMIFQRQIPDHPITNMQIFTEHGWFHNRTWISLRRWNGYLRHLSSLNNVVLGSIVTGVRITNCELELVVVHLWTRPRLEAILVVFLQMRADKDALRDLPNRQGRFVGEHAGLNILYYIVLVLLNDFYMVIEDCFEEGGALKADTLGGSFAIGGQQFKLAGVPI